MNESDAKAALRAMGILSPSRSLVVNWLRANEAAARLDEAARLPIQQAATQSKTTGSGKDSPISGQDLNAAIRALEAQGLPTTHRAVVDWIAQHRPEKHPAAAEQQPPAPQTSQAEPPPQTKGTSRLARFAVPAVVSRPRRKPGRPLTIASWFPAVAETMADGTSLRTALAIHGLTLSANEVRSLYRNKTFKGLYQEARRRYLIENWGRKGPSLRAILGRCI